MKEGEFVYIKWVDSYGVLSGWVDLSEYSPNLLMIESVERVIEVNDESLLHITIQMLRKILHNKQMV